MRKALLLIIPIIMLVYACQGGDSNAEENRVSTPDGPVYYTLLVSGPQSGVTKPGDIIIDTPEKLDSLWKLHYSYLGITPELPEIDFKQELVIGVFMGNQPSTGYWVKLDSVYVKGNEQIIALTTNETVDTSGVIVPIQTQPFVIAAVAKTGKHLKFDFAVVK